MEQRRVMTVIKVTAVKVRSVYQCLTHRDSGDPHLGVRDCVCVKGGMLGRVFDTSVGMMLGTWCGDRAVRGRHLAFLSLIVMCGAGGSAP